MPTEDTATCDRCGRPVADGARCCAACCAQHDANLDWIADLHTELETALTGQARFGEGSGGRTATDETPLPVNLRASDVGHRLRNTLTTWARTVIEERGFQEPEDDLGEIALFLKGVTGWIAHQAWGPEFMDDIGRVAVDLSRAIDSPPPMIALGQCDTDACDGQLRAHQEAAFTKCPQCRTPYDVAKRKDQLLARAGHLLLPAATLARALGIPAATIRGWAHDGKLTKRGQTPDHRPRYRLGDARALQMKAAADKAKTESETEDTEQNEQERAA